MVSIISFLEIFVCAFVLHAYELLMLFIFSVCSIWFVYLFTSLFSKKREKEGVEIDMWGCGEKLEGHVRRRTVIRIYNMKKVYFQLEKKNSNDQPSLSCSK